jgi:hypothetical protein
LHAVHAVIHKWTQYFDVYHRYFSRYVGKQVTLLEIGVQSGGSTDMWKTYFGPGLRYYGVDINPYTKALFDSPPSVQIFVGSQSNRTFWQKDVLPSVPHVDIVLDDGGHTTEQQITTFQELYGHVEQDGIYMVEDCATSYDAVYGGSLRKPGTWIEYSKQLIDSALHADYYNSGADRNNVTATTMVIGFYDQMVVFEKGSHTKAPAAPRRGTAIMDYMPPTRRGTAIMDDMPPTRRGTAIMDDMPPTRDGAIDPLVLKYLQVVYSKTNLAKELRRVAAALG